MKIVYESLFVERKEMGVLSGVEHALTPDPYSYNGELERLDECIKLQQEMMARLVEVTCLTPEQMGKVLGSDYKVTDE